MKPDQSDAEEGWLGAKFGDKEGWFPAAYAEELPADDHVASSAVTSAATVSAAATNALYSNVESSEPTPAATSNVDENRFATDFSAFRYAHTSSGIRPLWYMMCSPTLT